MSETLRELPKGDPVRLATAANLFASRTFDRSASYITDREYSEYSEELNGLEIFFQYVQKIDNNPTILDIGAGNTVAVSEIQEKYKNIRCLATVLSKPRYETTFDPKNRIHTSAELLATIPDHSISGILSCYGLTYAHSPKHAIRRIDEVLKSDGIIKARFPLSNTSVLGNKPSTEFIKELIILGYDVAAAEFMAGEILLAKKSGASFLSATSLLQADAHFMDASERMIPIPISPITK